METARRSHFEPVVQFTVFLENKLGRLHQFTCLLSSHQVHVISIMVVDATECSVVRLVVDDPSQARQLLNEHAYAFSEVQMAGVQMDSPEEFGKVLTSVLAAEINLNYLYPFLYRPSGKSGLIMHLEDVEMGYQVLSRSGFQVIEQGDISR